METNNKEMVLVVDDDYSLCQLIKTYLVQENFEVILAHDGEAALEKFKEYAPNLVLLDIMLPKQDGWKVCKEIRRISDVPILMLTAKGEPIDKILGLEIGADDYIVKPFNFRELIARMRAILRRYNPKSILNKQIIFPNFVINMNEYYVKIRDKVFHLPPKELEVLYYLAFHPNQVFTRQQLLDEVWGYDFPGSTRTIDVHIDRIRKKICSDEIHIRIKTVWGVGYKFEVNRDHA